MKNVQLLIATMDQQVGDYSLLEKMNVQTDAIVCNQCDYYSFEEFEWNDHHIIWMSFAEVGVGLNRNNALMRSYGDIIVFCDDDMELVDGYAQLLLDGFNSIPEAELLIFNIDGRPSNTSIKRINRFNYLRYGAARIAVLQSSVRENGIFFNQCFGGGTEHSHGEDNIFLSDCLKKGLKLFTYPVEIAKLKNDRPSTWIREYNNKYFLDQSALYKQISKNFWWLLCLQDAVRHRKRYSRSWKEVYYLMIFGEGEKRSGFNHNQIEKER